MTSAVRFGDGPVVALEGEPDDVRWLTGFLEPWFEASADAADRLVVVERVADMGLALADAVPLPAFTLDRGVLSLSGVLTEGGAAVEDDAIGATYSRDDGDGLDESLVVTTRGDLRARLGLFRVVRELSWAAIEAHDRVALHASAFELDGRAFVVAGPRRSGKTTFLLAALHHLGAGLVANDCVSVRQGATGPVVRGVATVVRVRPGTCDLLPEVAARLADSTSFVCLPGDLPPPRPESPDVHLGPRELARRLDRTAVSEAPVAAVLLLDGPGGPGGPDDASVRPADTELLDGARFGQDAATRPATVFSGPRAEPPSPRQALAGVPVVRLRATAAALTDPAQLRDALSAAAGAG